MWVHCLGLGLVVTLAGMLVSAQMDEQKFFFYWPTVTTQCQVSE